MLIVKYYCFLEMFFINEYHVFLFRASEHLKMSQYGPCLNILIINNFSTKMAKNGSMGLPKSKLSGACP